MSNAPFFQCPRMFGRSPSLCSKYSTTETILTRVSPSPVSSPCSKSHFLFSEVSSERIPELVLDKKQCIEKRDTPDDVFAFLELCLNHNPSARPSFHKCFTFFDQYVIDQKEYKKLRSPKPLRVSRGHSPPKRRSKPGRGSARS